MSLCHLHSMGWMGRGKKGIPWGLKLVFARLPQHHKAASSHRALWERLRNLTNSCIYRGFWTPPQRPQLLKPPFTLLSHSTLPNCLRRHDHVAKMFWEHKQHLTASSKLPPFTNMSCTKQKHANTARYIFTRHSTLLDMAQRLEDSAISACRVVAVVGWNVEAPKLPVAQSNGRRLIWPRTTGQGLCLQALNIRKKRSTKGSMPFPKELLLTPRIMPWACEDILGRQGTQNYTQSYYTPAFSTTGRKQFSLIYLNVEPGDLVSSPERVNHQEKAAV